MPIRTYLLDAGRKKGGTNTIGTIGIFMTGNYEPIWVPRELKKKIKTLANKKSKTIIKLLEDLLKPKG